MKIQRIVRGTIKTFELTPKEIGKAHNEYVLNLFKYTLVNDFGCNNEMAEKYAEAAYHTYCNGNKKEEWEQKTRELLQDFLKDFCSNNSSKEAEREE